MVESLRAMSDDFGGGVVSVRPPPVPVASCWGSDDLRVAAAPGVTALLRSPAV